MTILYLAHKPPYPIVDGGCLAMMECLKVLSAVATVDAFILETEKHPYSDQSENELKKYVRNIAVTQVDTKFRPLQAGKSLVKKENYNLRRFATGETARILTDLLQNKDYQFVVCDSLYAAATFAFYPISCNVPRIIRMHNIESELWKQEASNSKNWLKRFYFSSLARSLKTTEIALLKSAKSLWAITEEDRQWVKREVQHSDCEVLPVSVTVPESIQVDYSQSSFFHLGSMDWKPNQEAVSYLVNQLWNQNELQSIPLQIAGKQADQLKTPKQPNIRILGWVENSSEFMRKSGVLISPIQSGSGVRIKLLEAMALGVPCLTTSLGATGIDVQASGIRIAENPTQFVQAIQELNKNEQLRREIGEKSRAYMQKKHSFENCIDVVRKTVER